MFDRILLLDLGAFSGRSRGCGKHRCVRLLLLLLFFCGRRRLTFPLAAPCSSSGGRILRRALRLLLLCRLGLARKHRLDAVLALLDRFDERWGLDTYFADLFRHGVAICEPIHRARMHIYMLYQGESVGVREQGNWMGN